ncbi:MAG: TRAP transporter substrate-binding protein [Pseudomonadota bacterium]
MNISRRNALSAITAGAVSPALAMPALASGNIEWKLVTSWPKNLPGPGISAQMLADQITTMSDGKLTVKLFAAGELVPALETFDAVASGTAELAHTAPVFWGGKFAAAPLFTAGPFGLTPPEHMAWIYHGGGQALWDELYASSGVKPFMSGNTGFQMGGWFKRKINTIEDFQGLKMRIPGLGGRVIEKFGAVPVAMAPGEIFSAMQSGLLDATEFLGPFSDMAMGFQKVADYYYFPGWHEPNGTGEALVSLDAWNALSEDLKAIVQSACAHTNIVGLTQSEWFNAQSLTKLMEKQSVEVLPFPDGVLQNLRTATSEVLAELAATDELTGRIVESWQNAARHQEKWSNVSLRAFLEAR